MQRPRGWLLGWRDIHDHSSNLAHCLRSAQKLPKKGHQKMKITTYTKITYLGHVGIKTDVFICDKLPRLWQEMSANERYDYLNDMGYWDEGTDESYFGKDGSQTENVIEIEISEEFPEPPASTVPAPPDSSSRLFIGVCDKCLKLGTVYFISPNDSADAVCLTCYATAAAAEAAPTVTTPTPEAATKVSQASSVCIGGDFGGWVVYCTDNSSEWVEGLFPDQDSAQRFADVYKNEGDYTATPLLIMTANREGWSH